MHRLCFLYIYVYIYAKLSSRLLAVRRGRAATHMQGTVCTLAREKIVPTIKNLYHFQCLDELNKFSLNKTPASFTWQQLTKQAVCRSMFLSFGLQICSCFLQHWRSSNLWRGFQDDYFRFKVEPENLLCTPDSPGYEGTAHTHVYLTWVCAAIQKNSSTSTQRARFTRQLAREPVN